MGMFFNEHKVKQSSEETANGGNAPPNGNYRLGIDTRDNSLFVDSLCVDGTSLVKEIPDNPELPEGQLFLVHPTGVLLDYNRMVDDYTKGEVGSDAKQ